MMRTVLAILCFATAVHADAPKKLLLVGQGPDGHPKQTHEYTAGVEIVAKCLKDFPGIETTVVMADGPWKEGPELIERADGVLLFVSEGAKWVSADPKRLEAFQRLAKRGGGLAVLHWGMGTRDVEPIAPFVAMFGGCHGGPDRKYKVLDKVELVPLAKDHPVLTAVGPVASKEELYYKLKFPKDEKGLTALLKANVDGTDETVCWAWERPDGGRSFGFSGLHFHDNWKLPEYRRLVGQAALWIVKQPVPEKGLKVELSEKDLQVK